MSPESMRLVVQEMIPSTETMVGNTNDEQQPLLNQLLLDGLKFAFTRSRSSSLVAFLSGRSPLFMMKTISFCAVMIAEENQM